MNFNTLQTYLSLALKEVPAIDQVSRKGTIHLIQCMEKGGAPQIQPSFFKFRSQQK